MDRLLSEFYEFGNFRFNPAERYLSHKGDSIQLTPKALDTLFALVSRSGHLVTKDELLREVWQDSFVEEATVVQNISTLRKVLSRDGPDCKFIETVPKCGYRFIADVRICGGEKITPPVSEGPSINIAPVQGTNGNGAGLSAESEKPDLALDEFAAAGFGNSDRVERTRQFPWMSAGFAVIGLAVLVALGLFVARSFRQSRTSADSILPFEKMSFLRITQTGKARKSAISPDGKYVAYVALDAGKQSLWIRQVSAPNDSQIVLPAEVQYLGPTFSPDGNDVFFVTYDKGKFIGVLYRVPVIGGASQRITSDIDSPVTFSPDGKQISFVRGYLSTHETALIIANADGTNEQKLASRTFPAFFSQEGPAWSPTAALIACGVRIADGSRISETILGVEPASRKETLLTKQQWAQVGRLSWDKSGAQIVLTAAQELGPHQLWQISWPGGLSHRITNDLTDYRGVSLTSDLRAISTVAIEANSSVWVTSGPQYRAIELASTRNDGQGGIAWTPDARLVLTSNAGGESNIWIIDADGGRKQRLTSDNRRDFAPTVTRDGRFLIYSSGEAGSPAKIWRTNIDGSDPKQLTDGNDDRFPSCSFDGKWVFYSSFANDQNDNFYEKLWKVPIDGGPVSLFLDHAATRPMVSPDGKLIAFSYQATPDSPWNERIVSYDTGQVIKDVPAGVATRSMLQWAPDGRSLTFVATHDGISNLWSLPLNGDAPKQITHFDSGQIFRYAWSYDGKRLALARGVQNGDVVLIRNFG